MNYVCKVEDLDKLLPETLKEEFQALFSDNWRLRYVSRKEYDNLERGQDESDDVWKRRRIQELTPIRETMRNQKFKAFFDKYDIDYLHPTVRDAVAFDLVKLDDDSVSNDNIYTYDERKNYSPMEYERYLLNRNFRINLVNLDPDWSNISYGENGNDGTKSRRTVDKMYQGPRISKTLLDYFRQIVDSGSTSNIYVPFTNANDFSIEVALIPYTHPDFRQITSRAYYDTQWAKYKRLLKSYGITAIATFALVDSKKDKNHTGEYLVKIQYKVSATKFKYLVTTIDKDGHVVSDPIVSQAPTTDNTILCVCEDDFDIKRTIPSTREIWEPVEYDIPMVHSTTSSHYSIFRQRIPDYDLKLVRHYLQFKNRLEGMELCLEQVKRDVHHKEVRSAQCFAKLTMVLKRLMDEFSNNKELMDLVKRYYDLYAEWDKLTAKKVQMNDLKDGKIDLLRQLQDEYNALGNNQLDKKLALGQKIGSLKLELDKSIEESLQSIQDRLGKIVIEMNKVNKAIEEINKRNPDKWYMPEETSNKIKSEITESSLSDIKKKLKKWAEDHGRKMQEDDGGQSESSQPELIVEDGSDGEDDETTESDSTNRPALETLDTRRLHRLIVQSERWRNYSFNIGYELSQFKKMLTMCEDATIKVKRLLHNFEERMKDTQEQVWDKNFNIRPDFDFKDISVAGLRDIILLHDWWAANASNAKPEDLKMSEEQFMAFRRRCNKISYNLRKNQYAQLLAVKKDRAQRRISELEDIIKDKKTLHWDDKYGKEAIRDEGEEDWTLDKVDAKARERIRLLVMAQDIIDESEEDAGKERSISPTKDDLKKRKVSSFIDVELEDEEHLIGSPAPTKHQLARRKIVESVVNEETTYKKCVEMEKQYKEDSKRLVERTVNYLKQLGLIDTEADIERLVTLNQANQNPDVSKRWIDDIQEQKRGLDSAIELMQSQRKSMQSIIDNVAKMEGKIKELKDKNKRIFDICMKSGKKVKGVDRQVRNRMLMDKLDNEQRIFELKSLVKKAKSQHLEDFSALEKMRKDVDEKQEAYDEKVRCFKQGIGLTNETIDNLMVGIYNRFYDEILEQSKKRKKK